MRYGGVLRPRRARWVCWLCDWNIDDLAVVFDDSEAENCERFAFSSSDTGKIHRSRTFVAFHSECEVDVSLWHANNSVYPWISVEIPNRFRSNGIPQQLINLRAVPEVLEYLLRNRASQPLLVIRVLYERDPNGDSKRS